MRKAVTSLQPGPTIIHWALVIGYTMICPSHGHDLGVDCLTSEPCSPARLVGDAAYLMGALLKSLWDLSQGFVSWRAVDLQGFLEGGRLWVDVFETSWEPEKSVQLPLKKT